MGGCKGSGMRRYAGKIPFLIVTCFMFCCAGSSANATGSLRIPTEVSALVEQAGRAVNSHRPEVLDRMAKGSEARFDWVVHTQHEWKADVLPLPTAATMTEFLAVFHCAHTCESDGDHVYRILRTDGGRAGWRLGSEIAETDTLGFRVRDHRIEASIDSERHSARFHDTLLIGRDEEKRIAGGRDQAEAAVRQARGEAASLVLLRLSDDYAVSSLRVEGDSHVVDWRQAGGVVALMSPAGKEFKLKLEYSGMLNHTNGDFVHDNEALIVSYWYPHIARLPATLTVTVTPPAGWKAIAQGEPIDTSRLPNGDEVVTWRNEIPTSYFSLAAGRYRITKRQHGDMQLFTYLLDDRPDLAERSLDILQDCLDFYQKLFGRFPYRRYSVVQTYGPFNGALEAYSFATFGPHTLPTYIPHELAHTWWGGILPNCYTQSMWNEAFANYSDQLYQRMSDGNRQGAVGQYKTSASSAAIATRLASRRTGNPAYDEFALASARDTEDRAQCAVGYGKGEQVLRLLEEEIGIEDLLQALTGLITSPRRGQAVEWADIERAVNRASGRDMGWFFDQWLRRAGSPRLTLVVDGVLPGPRRAIVGRILQRGSFYRMKMPIQVELRSGRIVQKSVEISGASTPFQIDVDGAPDRLVLDPEALFPISPAEPDQTTGDPFVHSFE